MTDQQYKAKRWLMGYKHIYKQVQSDRKLLEVLASKVNRCVAAYETDGSSGHDVEISKHNREDALLDYANQRDKLESEESELLRKTVEVLQIIWQLPESCHKDICRCIYLEGKKWEEAQDELHISKSTLDRKHREMLTELAKILNY